MMLGDQDAVDLLHMAELGRGSDPVRVTAAEVGPTGVDQQGLAGRRNHQSGLAALDVDEENFERFGRICRARQGQEKGKYRPHPTDANMLSEASRAVAGTDSAKVSY